MLLNRSHSHVDKLRLSARMICSEPRSKGSADFPAFREQIASEIEDKLIQNEQIRQIERALYRGEG